MSPVVIPVRDPADPAIADAGDRLRAGALVAFPTETVYGLGANALDADAVARIFDAKGRPAYNPVIAHVPDIDAAKQVVSQWSHDADLLATAFWPGPLTLVLPAAPHVPAILRAGQPTVGVRVPDHPIALALLRAAGVPVAAPSANRFTEVSPTTADHVVKGLGDRVGLVLDGGPCPVGIESTVIDLSGPQPTLLRPGAIARSALETVLGRPVSDPPVVTGTAARPAPGMVDRHYAPQAQVWLYRDPEWAEVTAALRARAERGVPGGVAAIWRTPHPEAGLETLTLPDDPAGYARALYAALHALDRPDIGLLLIERAPPSEDWAGVRDRLERAARSDLPQAD